MTPQQPGGSGYSNFVSATYYTVDGGTVPAFTPISAGPNEILTVNYSFRPENNLGASLTISINGTLRFRHNGNGNRVDVTNSFIVPPGNTLNVSLIGANAYFQIIRWSNV